ncbi:MAG: hypothetical protein CVV22_11650 [Ignavibacteriae bacterium HGW-Ignavibacteriae-1]|jgi:hypothetical protein|nr:MAG: hypothetical protein CVV22_11650 [Ignavibacteriae bacterium HGW-Ignavibacteriae-1]
MKKFVLVLSIIFVFSFIEVMSQTKIDVKTKFTDKSLEMQAVKAGILEMLKTVNWISMVEIGEKYSFWIKELTIQPNPENTNQSIIKFNLYLNTPAMFTEGKILKSRTIKFVVDPNEPLPISNPPELQRSLENLDKSINISTMEWVIASLGSGGLASIGYIAHTMTKVGNLIQKKFTPAQQTMGLWAGFYSLDALYSMLKEQGEF